jgi:hypothetical protein
MAQVIPNLGALSSFGTGLGQGIQSLASSKVAEMQKRNEQKRISNLLQAEGYSPNQANLFSSLPEKSLAQLLANYEPTGNQQQYQQPQLQQPQPQQNAEVQSLQERLSNAMGKPKPEQLSTQDLSQLVQGQKLQDMGFQQKSGGMPFDLSKIRPEDLFNQAAQQGLSLTPEQKEKITNKLQALQSNKDELGKLNEDVMKYLESQQGQQGSIQAQEGQAPQARQPLLKKRLTEAEKIAQKKLEIAERREKRETQAEESKESKAFADKVRSDHDSARDTRKRIDRMEELLDHGNLGSPLRNTIIDAFGEGILGPHGPKFNLKSWMTADAEEMEKLSSDFAKGAKDFFPGRVTDSDLKLYMRTVPSLMQSKAGNQRLINSLRSVVKAQDLKYNTMREIIKANGGKRPADLEDQVEDAIGIQLDKLANDFVKGPLIPKTGFGAGSIRY